MTCRTSGARGRRLCVVGIGPWRLVEGCWDGMGYVVGRVSCARIPEAAGGRSCTSNLPAEDTEGSRLVMAARSTDEKRDIRIVEGLWGEGHAALDVVTAYKGHGPLGSG